MLLWPHVDANPLSSQSSRMWESVHGCVEGWWCKFGVNLISIWLFQTEAVEEWQRCHRSDKGPVHPWRRFLCLCCVPPSSPLCILIIQSLWSTSYCPFIIKGPMLFRINFRAVFYQWYAFPACLQSGDITDRLDPAPLGWWHPPR